MENQASSNADIKAKIKNYFVEIEEDKFTKIRVVRCKHVIEWDGITTMRNRFMITEKPWTHSLKLDIDYRHTEAVDSVFFSFTYVNRGDGYPHMSNLVLYLIIDGEKTIRFNNRLVAL